MSSLHKPGKHVGQGGQAGDGCWAAIGPMYGRCAHTVNLAGALLGANFDSRIAMILTKADSS